VVIRGDTSVAPLSPIVGANHIIDIIVYWRPMFQPTMNKIIGVKHWRQWRLRPIRYFDTVIPSFYAFFDLCFPPFYTGSNVKVVSDIRGPPLYADFNTNIFPPKNRE